MERTVAIAIFSAGLSISASLAGCRASAGRTALEAYEEALSYLERREWDEAILRLERARALGFREAARAQVCEVALADAYLNAGRYGDALRAAERGQRIAQAGGDAEDPLPHLMLARALSYRYGETSDEGFRDRGREELRLYVEKASASGMEAATIAIEGEATHHRLETGRLISDFDYIKEAYPRHVPNSLPAPTEER